MVEAAFDEQLYRLRDRLWAIIGIITLSSRFPFAPPQVMAASLPTTWEATCITISGITGFTFPGMIEEPGWRAGSLDLGQPRPRT